MQYHTDFYAEIGEEEIKIELTLSYTKENNGIGEYEFWGFKGNDKGMDYADIYEYSWDKSNFTDEQNKEIETQIENNISKLESEIEESWKEDY